MTVRPTHDHLLPVDGEGDPDADGAEADPAVEGGESHDDAGPGALVAAENVVEAPIEEVAPRKVFESPPMPTQAEIDRHRITHLPYRCWCPECVEAFGREKPHTRTQGERVLPLISCDYAYQTDKGVFSRDELTEDERAAALRILVAFDHATATPFAHAVPRKGADPDGYVADQIRKDVLWLGHSKVVIRSDNEPALVQVIERALIALKASGVDAPREGSVPHDPQTNGAAESAVRLIKGQLRAMLLGLERQIKARTPLDHPIVAWLVCHAAMVRTLQVIGTDGLTAHQRARGGPGTTKLMSFGEICRYKCRSKENGIGRSGMKWAVGIWLGIERLTGQYILYDKSNGGIRHSRSLLPMPVPQKLALDAIREVHATPWSVHAAKVPEVIRIDRKDDVPKPDRLPQVRRAYIRQNDLDDHGYTEGCPKCTHIRVYGNTSNFSTPHSEACRDRITNEWLKTAEGQRKLKQVLDRSDKYLDEYARRTEPQAAPQGGQEDIGVGATNPESSSTSQLVPTPFQFLPFAPEEVPVAPPATHTQRD